MPKMKREAEDEAGWSRWITPVLNNYKLGCCDCGLIHNMEFDVIRVIGKNPDGSVLTEVVDDPSYGVRFRAQRNRRSTAQFRRHAKITFDRAKV